MKNAWVCLMLIALYTPVMSQFIVKEGTTEYFKVDNATGNVGIGIDQEIPDARLDVAGDIRFRDLVKGSLNHPVLTVDTEGNLSVVEDQQGSGADGVVTQAEFAGGSTKTLTLTLSDNSTVTADFIDNVQDNDNDPTGELQTLNDVLTLGNDANDQDAKNFRRISVGNSALPATIYGYNTPGTAATYPDHVGEAHLASFIRIDDYTSVAEQAVGYSSILDTAPTHKASRAYQTIIIDGALQGDTQNTLMTAAMGRSDGDGFSYPGPLGVPAIKGFSTRFTGNIPSTTKTVGLFVHNLRSGNDDYHIYTHGHDATSHIEGNVIMTDKVGINGATTLDKGLSVRNGMFLAGEALKNDTEGWVYASDARLKNIEGPYEKGLEEISQVNVVNFNYKQNTGLDLKSSVTSSGVIAQELQDVFPEAVYCLEDHPDKYLTVGTNPLFWAMINAIKELKTRIEVLENR